ncbi:MAG TPA: type III PLP-dependent enzyme [Streptosporangiaceae bacterium]|nr:type III PLP-dependent enzyme [Streptosporangiaceae bacterium]
MGTLSTTGAVGPGPPLEPGAPVERDVQAEHAAPVLAAVPARVGDLAGQLGSRGELPAYIYDVDQVAGHAGRIAAALPSGAEFYYAVKANPDPELLRAVAAHADGLEVSSGGELAHVAAHVPGCGLAFGGPGKSAAELASAVKLGARIHVESPHELRLLAAVAAAAAADADVLLRVNLPDAVRGEWAPVAGGTATGAALPAGALEMGGGPTPFGMDPGALDYCGMLLPGLPRLRLRGLHAHLASGLDAAALGRVAANVITFSRDWCGRRGIPRAEINVGGGMSVDYRRPDAHFDWQAYGQRLGELARPGETIRIEPGRAVTAYCGWYATRVMDVKRTHGEAFAVVAGGTHHLRTPAAKGHDQPFAVLSDGRWPHGWRREHLADEPVTLVGQLCTPKDVLARGVRVKRLRAGDIVLFAMAGAYAWNISHHDFLMHPPPGAHYVRGAPCGGHGAQPGALGG